MSKKKDTDKKCSWNCIFLIKKNDPFFKKRFVRYKIKENSVTVKVKLWIEKFVIQLKKLNLQNGMGLKNFSINLLKVCSNASR